MHFYSLPNSVFPINVTSFSIIEVNNKLHKQISISQMTIQVTCSERLFLGTYQDQLKWLNFLLRTKKILLAKIYNQLIYLCLIII